MGQGTLFAALQGIEDRRTKKGRRFPLPAIIAISMRDAFGRQRFDGDFSLLVPALAEALQTLGVDKKRKAPCDLSLRVPVDRG